MSVTDTVSSIIGKSPLATMLFLTVVGVGGLARQAKAQTGSAKNPQAQIFPGQVQPGEIGAGEIGPGEVFGGAGPQGSYKGPGPNDCADNRPKNCTMAQLVKLLKTESDTGRAHVALEIADRGDVSKLPELVQALFTEAHNKPDTQRMFDPLLDIASAVGHLGALPKAPDVNRDMVQTYSVVYGGVMLNENKGEIRGHSLAQGREIRRLTAIEKAIDALPATCDGQAAITLFLQSTQNDGATLGRDRLAQTVQSPAYTSLSCAAPGGS